MYGMDGVVSVKVCPRKGIKDDRRCDVGYLFGVSAWESDNKMPLKDRPWKNSPLTRILM